MAGNTGALLPAYLAVGVDDYKRNDVVKRLKSHLEPGFEDFNLDTLAASSELEPNDLLVSLNTMPFGSGPRLVIVEKADKLAKPVSEAIITYLESPNTASTLLLVAESLSRATRLYKAVQKVGAKAIIDCTPPKRWDLSRRVTEMGTRYGVSIDKDAAEELVARVGESQTMLDRQAQSLADHRRAAGRVTRRDVEELVARTAEVKPWDFLDALCARDAGRAMELYRLMQNPSQIALVSLVAGRIRELVCAKSLAARGQAAMLASELGRADWQVKNHGSWARRFSERELVDCLSACARTDRALKSGADADEEFVRLVLLVCGAA